MFWAINCFALAPPWPHTRAKLRAPGLTQNSLPSWTAYCRKLMNHSYGWSCCGMIAEFAATRLINCSEKLTNCSPSSQLWYQRSERAALISVCELSVFQFFLIEDSSGRFLYWRARRSGQNEISHPRSRPRVRLFSEGRIDSALTTSPTGARWEDGNLVQIVQEHLGKKIPTFYRAIALVAIWGGRGADRDRRAQRHSPRARAQGRHLHAYRATTADGFGF